MHIREIFDAIADDRVVTVRNGFDSLVKYPNGGRLDGATPETLMAALDVACDALRPDQALLCSSTVAAIETVSQEGMMPGCQRYADAAVCVRMMRDVWEERFSDFCQGAAA